MTYCEVRGYLAHTLLRDTDAMSMAHSLEVRVPFLDHRLVEFVYNLPLDFKVGNNGKHILKHEMVPLLPFEIVNREKVGFNLPVSLWLMDNFYDEGEICHHIPRRMLHGSNLFTACSILDHWLKCTHIGGLLK